jgi:hypothetical protein
MKKKSPRDLPGAGGEIFLTLSEDDKIRLPELLKELGTNAHKAWTKENTPLIFRYIESGKTARKKIENGMKKEDVLLLKHDSMLILQLVHQFLDDMEVLDQEKGQFQNLSQRKRLGRLAAVLSSLRFYRFRPSWEAESVFSEPF